MVPIKHAQPLYQQVYELVKKLILSGEIKPGSKISVSKLAEAYEISRTPLREALRQLQKEGLLIQDIKGTTVIELNKKDFDELCACRLILEKEIIKIVVREISDELIEQAEQLLKKTEENYHQSRDAKQTLELNSMFHDAIIHFISNKRLAMLLEQVRSLLLLYRANIVRKNDSLEIIEEHKQIIKAIKDRNEQKAVEIIEMHLLNDQRRGAKIFEAE